MDEQGFNHLDRRLRDHDAELDAIRAMLPASAAAPSHKAVSEIAALRAAVADLAKRMGEAETATQALLSAAKSVAPGCLPDATLEMVGDTMAEMVADARDELRDEARRGFSDLRAGMGDALAETALASRAQALACESYVTGWAAQFGYGRNG